MAGYAPTMGIIGTVLGLIHVLGNLANPDRARPAHRRRLHRDPVGRAVGQRDLAADRQPAQAFQPGRGAEPRDHHGRHPRHPGRQQPAPARAAALGAARRPRSARSSRRRPRERGLTAAAGSRGGGDHEEGHEGADERWLLSYADFITLLLALFMVLFALSTVEPRQVRRVPYGPGQRLRQLGQRQPHRARRHRTAAGEQPGQGAWRQQGAQGDQARRPATRPAAPATSATDHHEAAAPPRQPRRSRPSCWRKGLAG